MTATLAPFAGLRSMMRSPAFPPRRPSHLLRYLLLAVVFILVVCYYNAEPAPPPFESGGQPGAGKLQTNPEHETVLATPPNEGNTALHQVPIAPDVPETSDSGHPIDSLIRVADANFNGVMAKESHSLAEAAKAYRERRGRHPPPGFKAWYEFAKANDALIIEDFWDQIYHDLNPFWGIDAARIRKEAWDYEMTINIRNGNASAESDWFWTQIWLDMIKTIEHLLPDMDIALNAMDEPRLVVPWEEINGYMEKEKKTRGFAPVGETVNEFRTLSKPGSQKRPRTRSKKWEKTGAFRLMAGSVQPRIVKLTAVSNRSLLGDSPSRMPTQKPRANRPNNSNL